MAGNSIDLQDGITELPQKRKTQEGTVQILDQNGIILIPKPTSDPKGAYCSFLSLVSSWKLAHTFLEIH